MGRQTRITCIECYNSGIGRNCWESLPIPFHLTIPEFRAELDDRVSSQTHITSIECYNSGIGRNRWESLPIPSHLTIPEFRAELDD